VIVLSPGGIAIAAGPESDAGGIVSRSPELSDDRHAALPDGPKIEPVTLTELKSPV
jgi:hypothetical protein